MTTSDAEIDSLKERVATACRVLARLDLTREPAGHVSASIPGTGACPHQGEGPGRVGRPVHQAEDIVEVDMSGKMLSSIEGFIAPREVYIHTWMYRQRPEVNSVIHIPRRRLSHSQSSASRCCPSTGRTTRAACACS